MKWLWIEAWTEANVCKAFTSLNLAIARSRRLNGWCECSARLLSQRLVSWRPSLPIILIAARYGHCQTNADRSWNSRSREISGCKLTPLGQGGGAIEFEVLAVVKMTFLIEMIVNRGVGGSKLLQGLDVPEPGHRAFSSPERLV